MQRTKYISNLLKLFLIFISQDLQSGDVRHHLIWYSPEFSNISNCSDDPGDGTLFQCHWGNTTIRDRMRVPYGPTPIEYLNQNQQYAPYTNDSREMTDYEPTTYSCEERQCIECENRSIEQEKQYIDHACQNEKDFEKEYSKQFTNKNNTSKNPEGPGNQEPNPPNGPNKNLGPEDDPNKNPEDEDDDDRQYWNQHASPNSTEEYDLRILSRIKAINEVKTDNTIYRGQHTLNESSIKLFKDLSIDHKEFQVFNGNKLQQIIHHEVVASVNYNSFFNNKYDALDFAETVVRFAEYSHEKNKEGDIILAAKSSDVCYCLTSFAKGVVNACGDKIKQAKAILNDPIGAAVNVPVSLACSAMGIAWSVANFFLHPKTDDVYIAQIKEKYRNLKDKYDKATRNQIAEKLGFKTTNYLIGAIFGRKKAGVVVGSTVLSKVKRYLEKTNLTKYVAEIISKAFKKGVNKVKSAINYMVKDRDIALEILQQAPKGIRTPDFISDAIEAATQYKKVRTIYASEISKNYLKSMLDKNYGAQLKKFGLNEHFVPPKGKGIAVNTLASGTKITVDKFGRIWKKFAKGYPKQVKNWLIEYTDSVRKKTGSFTGATKEKIQSVTSEKLQQVFHQKVNFRDEVRKEYKRFQKVNGVSKKSVNKNLDNLSKIAAISNNQINEIAKNVSSRLNRTISFESVKHYARQTKNELKRSLETTSRLLKDHKEKLEQYIKDPFSMDNKNILKNVAPNRKNDVIQIRINKLQLQIRRQSNDVEIINELMKLREQL